MSVISINTLLKLRSERERDSILAQNEERKQEAHGELEAYGACLRLMESIGRKVATVVNGKILESVDIPEGARRRAEWTLMKMRQHNDAVIASSVGKTPMLEYLTGHSRGLQEAIQIIGQGD
jgi:hypothetical protein